jgi:hypothetical protein
MVTILDTSPWPSTDAMRAAPPLRLTWHQAYAGGRIVAKLGEIEVGAVFPPIGETQHKHPYAWRFWLGNVTTPRQDGSAKSELAAKSALTARVADWLRDAGLQQVPDA